MKSGIFVEILNLRQTRLIGNKLFPLTNYRAISLRNGGNHLLNQELKKDSVFKKIDKK